jgi:hypothetical protein
MVSLPVICKVLAWSSASVTAELSPMALPPLATSVPAWMSVWPV